MVLVLFSSKDVTELGEALSLYFPLDEQGTQGTGSASTVALTKATRALFKQSNTGDPHMDMDTQTANQSHRQQEEISIISELPARLQSPSNA